MECRPLSMRSVERLLSHQYEISGQISSSNHGYVFIGRKVESNETIVLKIMLTPSEKDNDHELSVIGKISGITHPNIVPVYDFGTTNQFDYVAMPYIEGETLEDYMEKGPIDTPPVLEWMQQMCGALHCFHNQNIVHGDLKPLNYMVSSENRPILIDFSSSWQAPLPEHRGNGGAGSCRYISPEQIMGTNVDFRSDLYSLGIIFYQMITGCHPFKGKSVSAWLNQQLHKVPNRYLIKQQSGSKELADIVMKLLRKSPEHRFQTSGSLFEAISKMALQTPTVG